MVSDNSRGSNTEIYVGNVSSTVDTSHLSELLTLAGPAEVSVPRNADNGHRGFAFGIYATRHVAEYAIRLLDGLLLAGQPLKVRFANGR